MRIINHQIELHPGSMQLLCPFEQRRHVGTAHGLAYQALQSRCVGIFAAGADHALNLVPVAAGDHGLTQERLARPLRPYHHLQLFGKMSHVMQLCQDRLAARREEPEPCRTRHKGIMLQLIMQEKLFGICHVIDFHRRTPHHCPTPARIPSSTAASKSPVTTASPNCRSNTRRSCPSSTFLSTAISCLKSSANIPRGGAVGSPALAIRSMPRRQSSAGSQPSWRDISSAMTMPAPTASPCSQVPYP